MDSSFPIDIQPPKIALDRCLAFLDQDVLRIRSAVDSFVLRRRDTGASLPL